MTDSKSFLGKTVRVVKGTYAPNLAGHEFRVIGRSTYSANLALGLPDTFNDSMIKGHNGNEIMIDATKEAAHYIASKRVWYVPATGCEVVEAKKKSLSPQCTELLKLLQQKGTVTALEAGGVLRIRALPRRISDLKEHGYSISRELKTDQTGQRYARYFLEGEVTGRVAA